MPADVDAALKFLTSQDNVNSNALGVVGGDCGSNQAVHAAERHPTVRTLVLMSGGTDAGGEAFIKNSPKIPILGIASEEDIEGAAAVTALRQLLDSGWIRSTERVVLLNTGTGLIGPVLKDEVPVLEPTDDIPLTVCG